MGRNQSGTQGLLVSWFGKDKGTVRNGAQRLGGAAVCAIPISVDAGETDPQLVGLLTEGLSVLDVIVQSESSAGTTVTLSVGESADGADDGFNIVTAADATATGSVAPAAAAAEPLASDRVLRATVAAGSPGESVDLALIVAPQYKGWN